MTVAYKISLKAAVVSGSAETMAESIAAVAEHLDDIQQHTLTFLGFTLSSDRRKRTALFNMYVDEDTSEKAVAAAHAWAATAINAAGDGTREWTMYAHPEDREQVPA
jgi:2-iminoacetate synthase ThiH